MGVLDYFGMEDLLQRDGAEYGSPSPRKTTTGKDGERRGCPVSDINRMHFHRTREFFRCMFSWLS